MKILWQMQIKPLKACSSLATILQEPGNCHLYKKTGYRKTGKIKNIKEGMDLVYYEKN